MILGRIKSLRSQNAKIKSPKDSIQQCLYAMKDLRNAIDISQSPDVIEQLIREENSLQKKSDLLHQRLHDVRIFLYGSDQQEPKKQDVHEIASETYKTALLQQLIDHFATFNFEARKDATQIFNNLIKLKMNNSYATVDYILGDKENHKIVFKLIEMSGNGHYCTLSGSMLRECIKHEKLAELVLYSDHFYLLFDYVDHANFEIASDAFLTLKDLLSRHKALYATYMETHFDRFFSHYTQLLQSKNYVTKRQCLKLLAELLVDRTNFKIMIRFINIEENLKLLMMLLLDKSKAIQFEAFHVFKVFVANPNKSKAIRDILAMNKKKLVKYLKNFQSDLKDESFNEEKELIIETISNLEQDDQDDDA